MKIFVSTEMKSLGCLTEEYIHPNDYIQPLIEAVWNDNSSLFSSLVKNVNINQYYRDNFDEEGEGTLVSRALLDVCFYSSNTAFLEEILVNKPDVDLPIAIYSDGSASLATLTTWLQATKNDLQESIDEADGFELLALKSYLPRIEMVIAALGIKDLT